MIRIENLANRDFATVSEVAEILRLDDRTIRRRCAEGVIPGIKAGDWRIPVAWLRRQAEGVPAGGTR